MKVEVWAAGVDQGWQSRTHEADIVAVAVDEGVLKVSEEQPDGTIDRWAIYAPGEWAWAQMLERPSEDVAAAARAHREAQREKTQPRGGFL